jgi:hypothetical protein
MNNAYQGAKLVLRGSHDPIEALRFGKNKEMALSSATGEINAYDKKDLLQKMGQLMQAVENGDLIPATASSEGDFLGTASDRRELLAEAAADSTGQKWQAIGASLTRMIEEQRERDGFARKLLVGNTLKQGEICRVPMPKHDARAVVATGTATVGVQTIRTRVFTPDEFEITANLRVENLDLQQVSGDLLDRAYNDGLQAIMVAEDRLWKKAVDETVGYVNDLELIAGELTPKNLGNLRQAVARWNLPATTMLLASDYWADVIGSNDFATFFDPISKYDLVLNGQIGTLVGMTILTDAYRQPNQKVMNPGEIYVVSDAQNHGVYTTRGGIQSAPIDGRYRGDTSRGWFMSEPYSQAVTNMRSVVKARRM